ncbi:MAG: hypothetical protein WDO14_02600 [Bacteroidota bacterium]
MIRRIYSVLTILLMTVTAAIAQDVTSDTPVLKNKKGEAYLPVTEEWALGVSATPFLGYLGNFLNGTLNQGSPAFTYGSNPANNIAIYGKKMIDEHTAYRVRFNVTVRNIINKAVVVQDNVNADPAFPAFAEDWQKATTTAIVIAPGWEKRRGSTRLQGIYGGELVIGMNVNHIKYQYGNPITADFQAPTTSNFAGQGFGNNILGGGARVTEDKQGMNFLVGARGFIGVEYFIIPKISIGGEFGYMLAWQTQRRNTTTSQAWDDGNNNVRETKTDSYSNGGRTTLGIGIDNLSGSVNLLFYF